MLVDDLDTPALLVDQARLARNIRRMQARADDEGVTLRPHVKTHKTPAIARRQQAEGASGVTVAKVGEAEVFVDAGFDDVRVAYPVIGEQKHERLLALHDRADLSFCVDTTEGAEMASAFYAAHDVVADVCIEVDVGHGRCGVPWDGRAAVPLAQRVNELPGLQLEGLLTHAGQAYHGPDEGEAPEEALRRHAAQERDRMLAVAQRLREAGIEGATPDALEISIGSTPTMAAFENASQDGFQVTEIRPGNYVFYDMMQVGLGACTLNDCALTVLARIVSKRRDPSGAERVYLDAGKKVVTTDTGYDTDGYGQLLYNAEAMRPHPHATIQRLSEEHAWVRVPGGATFGVGDRQRFVPNHACVTVASQDRMYLVEDGEIVDEVAVAARGRFQ
jgi:D-serine deaminase-like pyridoxal phosphate-dependent protein